MKFHINYHKILQSTNKTAFEMAKNGALEGEIILADAQNQGRGRLNRDWSSPPGNLYFSLILRPETSIELTSQISFIAAISLKNTLKKLILPENDSILVQNKWPNDILLNSKKTAGILLESRNIGQKCDFTILGVGLNILSNPKNTNFAATNLKNFIQNPQKSEILEDFLQNFAIFYQKWQNFGFLPIKNLWLEDCWRLNQEISVNGTTGIMRGLDDKGSILLEGQGGVTTIDYGDVC